MPPAAKLSMNWWTTPLIEMWWNSKIGSVGLNVLNFYQLLMAFLYFNISLLPPPPVLLPPQPSPSDGVYFFLLPCFIKGRIGGQDGRMNRWFVCSCIGSFIRTFVRTWLCVVREKLKVRNYDSNFPRDVMTMKIGNDKLITKLAPFWSDCRHQTER